MSASLANADGGSPPQSVDLESGGSHIGVQRGLVGASAFGGAEIMYRMARRFPQQLQYCMSMKANLICMIWKDIENPTRESEKGRMELVNELLHNIKDMYQTIILAHQIDALQEPNARVLDKVVTATKLCLEKDEESGEEDGVFLSDLPEDWVMVNYMETLDRWIQLIPEYTWGLNALNPFCKKTDKYDGFETRSFPDGPFKVIGVMVSHFIMVGLIGTPVVVQILYSTSVAVSITVYLVCLVCFIAFTQIFVPSRNAQFIMTLAWAAVAVTNMSQGRW